MPSGFDFVSFEHDLYLLLHEALSQLGQRHASERFYAVALHGVYRDGAILTLPTLGAAAESAEVHADAEGLWGARWNPADWTFAELELEHDAALVLEQQLTAEATRLTSRYFDAVERRYFAVLVAVARRLRGAAESLLPLAEDFVVFVHDEGNEDLAAVTIPPPLFAKLFPAQVEYRQKRDAIAALSSEERARALVAELTGHGAGREDASELLLELGESAVPLLLELVGHKRHGWWAAKLLGQLGLATPDVVAALRAGSGHEAWHARALGLLGDDAWLAARPAPVAVPGLCARFKAVADATCPLDYAPLDAYLSSVGAAVAEVEKELAPGSSYTKLSAQDVDEALRGLKLQHAVLRWHAAAVLCPLHLSARARKREIVAALAQVLVDAHPFVRRLAIVSLQDWKPTNAQLPPLLHALSVNDPDETVRRVATALVSR